MCYADCRLEKLMVGSESADPAAAMPIPVHLQTAEMKWNHGGEQVISTRRPLMLSYRFDAASDGVRKI